MSCLYYTIYIDDEVHHRSSIAATSNAMLEVYRALHPNAQIEVIKE
jgi:hypothetical protein